VNRAAIIHFNRERHKLRRFEVSLDINDHGVNEGFSTTLLISPALADKSATVAVEVLIHQPPVQSEWKKLARACVTSLHRSQILRDF
jgi:hypothetical protein